MGETSYIVIGQPDKNIPVYKVKRESGKGQEKTLHKNMLLPFSVIPLSSEVDILLSNKNTNQTPRRGKADKMSDFNTASAESSESEAESFVPVHIPGHRNRDNQGRVKQSFHEPVHDFFSFEGIPSGRSEQPFICMSDRNLST